MNLPDIFPFMKLLQFQSYLQKNKIDLAFFVHPDVTITYFTQMKPSYAILTITPKTATLYLTDLDSKPKLRSISIKKLKKGWDKELAKTKAKTIAINKETLSVSQLEKIKKIFPKAHFTNVSKTLHELRAQKTPQEIKKIAQACHITTNAFNHLVKELPKKTLKTEQDVALFLEKSMRQQGGDIAFPTIVAMGKNAAIPHHVTITYPLHKGFLILDFGASYQHYCADMTRVLYLGNPSVEEENWYSLLLKSQEAALSAVAKNVPFSTLDKISRKNLGKYSSHFIHSLGHGVGLEIHEAPSFFEDRKNVIKPNQVFTIEPGIYFPGKFGLRIEDTLVFDGKVNILTSATKKLIKIKY